MLYAVLYAICAILTARWFGKKLDELEDRLWDERRMDLNQIKVAFWMFLSILVWWFVLLKERITDFRQWKYPYCDPEAMGNIRSYEKRHAT